MHLTSDSLRPATQQTLVPQGSGPSRGAQPIHGARAATLQNAAPVQSLSTQALLTLLQALGKPLPGLVMGDRSVNLGTGQKAGQLPIQLSVPSPSQGQANQVVQSLLPVQQDQPLPPGGTRLTIAATRAPDGRAQLDVNLFAKPAVPLGQNDAALAPRSHGSKPQAATPLTTIHHGPLEVRHSTGSDRLVLNSNQPIDADTLKAALSQGVAAASRTPAGASQVSSTLVALIRALGLNLPSATQPASPSPTPPATGTRDHSEGADAQTPRRSSPTAPPSRPQTEAALPRQLATHIGGTPIDNPTFESTKAQSDNALARTVTAPQTEPSSMPGVRVELPIYIGQELTKLWLAFDEHEAKHNASVDEDAVWRFRFAFESETIGGMEALVALRAPRDILVARSLDIGVWAQSAAVVDALDNHRETLAASLKQHGIELSSLTIAVRGQVSTQAANPADRHRTSRVDTSL